MCYCSGFPAHTGFVKLLSGCRPIGWPVRSCTKPLRIRSLGSEGLSPAISVVEAFVRRPERSEPGGGGLQVSDRGSWGVLPQTPVFSLRSGRCHWHSSITALTEHQWRHFWGGPSLATIGLGSCNKMASAVPCCDIQNRLCNLLTAVTVQLSNPYPRLFHELGSVPWDTDARG
jgi:hypothetical protein